MTRTTLNAIVVVHACDPEFGYRFIADELERAGEPVNERRVWRLCRARRAGRARLCARLDLAGGS
jgi:HTH-like domain